MLAPLDGPLVTAAPAPPLPFPGSDRIAASFAALSSAKRSWRSCSLRGRWGRDERRIAFVTITTQITAPGEVDAKETRE